MTFIQFNMFSWDVTFDFTFFGFRIGVILPGRINGAPPNLHFISQLQLQTPRDSQQFARPSTDTTLRAAKLDGSHEQHSAGSQSYMRQLADQL